VSTPTLAIRHYEACDRDAVVALWRAAGNYRPWNDPDEDIRLSMETPSSALFVGFEAGELIATTMAGCDGHRGWVYYVAVAPERQGRGIGQAMMRHAEGWLRSIGVRKLELLVREGNEKVISFYERLGYERQKVVTFGRWLDGTQQP
jgi:ribosomal protein S18 acetylase RimI-like enzyme